MGWKGGAWWIGQSVGLNIKRLQVRTPLTAPLGIPGRGRLTDLPKNRPSHIMSSM